MTKINKDCVGCMMCSQEYPHVFSVVNSKAKIINKKLFKKEMGYICPVGAIE